MIFAENRLLYSMILDQKSIKISQFFFICWFWVSKYVLIIFAHIFGSGGGLVYLGMTLRFLHQFPWTLCYTVFFLQVSSMYISLINDYRLLQFSYFTIQNTIDRLKKEQNYNHEHHFQQIFRITLKFLKIIVNHLRIMLGADL